MEAVRSARRSDSLGVSTALVAITLGLICGHATFTLEYMGIRYLVYGFVGAVYLVALMMASNVRRFLLSTLIFSLQFDASMFFMYRGDRHAGNSGPPGLNLPLPFIVAALLLVVTAWDAFVSKEQRWYWGGPIGAVGLALVGTVALSVTVSPERFITFCASVQAVQYLVVFLVLLNAIRTRDDAYHVLRLLSVLLVFQSALYFLQNGIGETFRLNGGVRVHDGEMGRQGGTVGTTPAGFASFVMPLLMVAVARLLMGWSGKNAWRHTGVVAIGLLAVIMTYTRAVWAALALGVTVLLAITVMRGAFKLGNLTRLAAFGVLGIILLLPKIQLRLSEDVQAAYDERQALMLTAWRVIEEHPLRGIGAGAYSWVFGNFLQSDVEGFWVHIVHNEYLLRWAETGVFGVLAWVAFMLLTLREAYRMSKSSDPELAIFGLGMTAGMVALAWEMYWDVWRGFTFNALLWALSGFTLALRRIDGEAVAVPHASAPQPSRTALLGTTP